MNLKRPFITVTVLALMGLACVNTSCSSSTATGNDSQDVCQQLPRDAQTTLKKLLVEVDSVSYDEDDGVYDVILADGVELGFDEKGEWRRVFLRKNKPADGIMDFLPANAQQYLNENFPDQRVRKMKRNRRNFYTVQLGSRELLHFSKTGKFVPNDVKQLPSETKSLLAKYFAADSVVSATVDVDREYSVELASGTVLEFDKYGVFDRIEAGKGERVPQQFLSTFPSTMVKYLEQNQYEKNIKRIARKSYGYSVKTGKPSVMVIGFNKSGNFLKNVGNDEE